MSTENDNPRTVDLDFIRRALPHRYPFALIDRVVDYKPDEWIKALKNVTLNEPHFEGHFPGHPIMPGVLILEALAQACGVLVQASRGDEPDENPMFYLVKIEKARFSGMVTPGDQLILESTIKRKLRNMALYTCEASVDGKAVATAELLCADMSEKQ